MGLKSKHNEAAALVAQMTNAEKAGLCSGKNFWHLKAVERLDVPAVMVTDGPHGLRKQDQEADHVGLNQSVPATCFPTACALASSWDVELLQEVGVALGEQCAAENVTVLLGPGMNIKRHPLCGRNFEYFSEDPYLNGKLAAALIKGVQSQGVGTSVKHFAVNNQEHGRMYMDAIVDERTLREIYLRGFEIAIREAQPWTVMCAYNRVNGVYCSEHDWLLNKVLRDEWGFEGLVVTDWGAANDRVEGVRTGLDLEMPSSGGINDTKVLAALEGGSLAAADLDQAITRNVALSLLGAEVADKEVSADQAAHHQLAVRAAAESMVLLQNHDDLLPLDPRGSLCVVGAFAKHPRYQGGGSSQVNPTRLDTAYTAIASIADAVLYAPGYDPEGDAHDQGLIDTAVASAQQCEVAVVFAGLPSLYESEGFDRPHMHMPEQHVALIEAVCAANPNTVVVLSNGAPIACDWQTHPMAILEAYLAGQGGGPAIAEVLFGLRNPSGKLAETFPLRQTDVAADNNFPGAHRQIQYREGLQIGYRHFDQAQLPVRFCFGHGLSYTTFAYQAIDGPQSLQAGEILNLDLTLQNSGTRIGAEVVQVYVHPCDSPVYRPQQELKAFCKVRLEPGEQRKVRLSLGADTWAYYDRGNAGWTSIAGTYDVRIGSSSRDIRLTHRVTLTSEAEASEMERHAHRSAQQGAIDDDAFAAMLGHAVPAPEASRPFHLNSSLQEVGSTWLGRKFKARVVAGFMQSMGDTSNDPTLKKMFEEMANHMPLRALALFSRGATTFTDLEIMIALMNRRYTEALRRWRAR